MKRLSAFVRKLDISFEIIAGVVLAFMMIVTVSDIVMRALGHPIMGTVEIVTFCGAIVIGFSLPYSSFTKMHVFVDLLIERLSPRSRAALVSATKAAGCLFFVFVGYNFILFGLKLMKTGEVSSSFRIPYYPVTFGLAMSCFLESLTLLLDTLKTMKGGRDE
jgi:TRAP-type C4-dicarboxylate transport system permease small subunit